MRQPKQLNHHCLHRHPIIIIIISIVIIIISPRFGAANKSKSMHKKRNGQQNKNKTRQVPERQREKEREINENLRRVGAIKLQVAATVSAVFQLELKAKLAKNQLQPKKGKYTERNELEMNIEYMQFEKNMKIGRK